MNNLQMKKASSLNGNRLKSIIYRKMSPKKVNFLTMLYSVT